MEPRNYLANATANPPTKPAGPSNGYPQTATPGVNPATSPGPHWFYKIGEGLRSLITGSGQTPSDDDLAQVLKGIKRFSGGNVTTLADTTTLTLDQAGLVLVDATAGNIILTLPSAADLAALQYEIVRIDSSSNTVTLAADGAETVNGAATLNVSVDSFHTVKSNGVDGFHLVTTSNAFDIQQVSPSAGFFAHQASTPDMTIVLNPGKIQNGITLTDVADQPTAAFVAPVTNPRIDRIVIDSVTGVYSVIAGAEAAGPVAPDLIAGKIADCQVLLQTDTTEITNSMITDERTLQNIGASKDYVNNRMRGGRVNSSGAILGQSGGFSLTKQAAGNYKIIHNKGSTNYSPVAIVSALSYGVAIVIAVNANDFIVQTGSLSGTDADVAFNFSMASW